MDWQSCHIQCREQPANYPRSHITALTGRGDHDSCLARTGCLLLQVWVVRFHETAASCMKPLILHLLKHERSSLLELPKNVVHELQLRWGVGNVRLPECCPGTTVSLIE